MKSEVCPCCGKPKDATVAFGMQKTELSKLFRNTVGPGGYQERKKTGRTGYELFALALEKKSAEAAAKKEKVRAPVTVSSSLFRRTESYRHKADSDFDKTEAMAEDIYDFIVHSLKSEHPIKTTKHTFRKVGKLTGRDCELAVAYLKKQGRIRFTRNLKSLDEPTLKDFPRDWIGYIPT